jgi:tetratricopeptide (TPR) repeat protein
MLDEAGLATAEWMERTSGPLLALPLYKKLIPKSLEGTFCMRAALGALRCAVKLGNEKEIDELSDRYTLISNGGEHVAEIIAMCKTLVKEGRRSAAVTLARAEAERNGRARAYYLLGRCLELIGDFKRAFEAFGHAATLADKEGNAADVALAARAKRVERMLGDQTSASIAFTDAAEAVPAGASPEQKLVIALGRMRSPSKYTRASGLSLLEELARDPTTSLGRQAIRMAVEHADALGDALTSVEVDRIGATIRHVPDEAARNAALARLVSLVKIATAKGDARADAIMAAGDTAPEIVPLLRRIRAFLSGADPGVQASHAASAPDVAATPSLRINSLGLDAVAALKANRVQQAAETLQEVGKLFQAGTVVTIPNSLWIAARMALDASHPTLREAGVNLAEGLMAVAIVAPPLGFSGLARGLDHAGRRDLAMRACNAAINAHEDGADELYGSMLRTEGWALAVRGQREAAIDVLRKAQKQFTAANPAQDKPR